MQQQPGRCRNCVCYKSGGAFLRWLPSCWVGLEIAKIRGQIRQIILSLKQTSHDASMNIQTRWMSLNTSMYRQIVWWTYSKSFSTPWEWLKSTLPRSFWFYGPESISNIHLTSTDDKWNRINVVFQPSWWPKSQTSRGQGWWVCPSQVQLILHTTRSSTGVGMCLTLLAPNGPN